MTCIKKFGLWIQLACEITCKEKICYHKTQTFAFWILFLTKNLLFHSLSLPHLHHVVFFQIKVFLEMQYQLGPIKIVVQTYFSLFHHILKMDWTRQNVTMLFPTYNTYARTFTQSTTREEMKIVITYRHNHLPSPHPPSQPPCLFVRFEARLAALYL